MGIFGMGKSLGVALIAALVLQFPAEAGESIHPYTIVFPNPVPDQQRALAQSSAGVTIPLWTHRVAVSSEPDTSYQFEMVGQDPFVAESNPVTTITVPIIPVIIGIGSAVFDPTVVDPVCSPAGAAVDLVQNSPVFQSIKGNQWGTSSGAGQYIDLFQRANFRNETRKEGINPGYHIVLNPVIEPAVVIQPGLAEAQFGAITVPSGCGGVQGEIEVNAWNVYVQSVLIAALDQETGVGPKTLPIFLFYNVVMYDFTAETCCILGYHASFFDPQKNNDLRTYIVDEFDATQSFTGIADVSSLSHEVAEWMDDPQGNNPTPGWGHTGQVTGCQYNLEVGDPLLGTLIQIYNPANAYTYHVQDLAFYGWFFAKPASPSLNGWYSLAGNFLKHAAPCLP
jgi:hypothetical protein